MNFIDNILFNPILAALLWMLIYLSDRLLTILAIRLYAGYVSQHAQYDGGLELTPLWKKDVSKGNWLSPRFIFLLLLTGALVFTLGWLLQDASDAFELFLGGWFLLEAAIHIRHFRNLATFYYVRRAEDIQGFIRYPMWLSYRVSAVEMLGFFLLYLLIYLLLGRLFFLGGVISAAALAVYHGLLGARARKASRAAAARAAAGEGRMP